MNRLTLTALLAVAVGYAGCSVGDALPDSGSPPAPGWTKAPPTKTLIDGPPVGQCHDGSWTADAHPVLRFHLETGTYLQVAIEQLGIDLVVRASGPGLAPITFDSPGDDSTERAVLVAAATGAYELTVSPWASVAGGSPTGHFRACTEARRPATDRDRTWATAAGRYYRAHYGVLPDDPEETHKRSEFVEVARLADDLGETAFRARVLHDLGVSASRYGSRQAATEALATAVASYRDLGDQWNEARSLDALGAAWRTSGDLNRSHATFEQARALWQVLERPADEATTLSNLGLVAQEKGRFRAAFARYREALAIREQLGDRCRAAATRVNLGAFYTQFGERNHARDQYVDALSSSADCPKTAATIKTRAAALTGLGDLLLDQSEPAAAIGQYREALQLRREIRDQRGEAVTLNSLGMARTRDDPRAAFGHFREALHIFEQLERPRDQAVVLRSLTRLQEASGDTVEALASATRALTLTREVADTETESLVLLDLAWLARESQSWPEAERHTRAAIALIETLRRSIVRDDLRAAFLADRQTYYDTLVTTVVARHQEKPTAGHAMRGFAALERARSRTLLDSLARPKSSIPRPELEELNATINAVHRDWVIASATGTEVSRGRIEVELRSLLSARHALDLGDAEIATTSVLESDPFLDLEAAQAMLDPNSVLLAFHLTPTEGWLWAITAEHAEFHDLRTGRDEMATLVAAYRDSELQRTPGPGVLGDRLSKLLLAPVADVVASRRLLIVAPGLLQSLPFAALPHPVAPRPLGIGNEIVHLPSMTAVRALRARSGRKSPTGTTPTALVIADAIFGADDPRLTTAPSTPSEGPRLDPLPATRREAAAVRDHLGPAVRGIFGFEARRDRFFDGSLQGVNVLHIATHALLDVPSADLEGARPMVEAADLASLVFSRFDREGRPVDGYLRAYEIRQLDLHAELVVLSACRTVLGEDQRGDGLVGLTHAFLTAGAHQVVASLWDLDDRATAALMTEFYAGLRAGLSASAALHLAQAAVRQQDSWRAPYFWAGFAVHGDWLLPGDMPGKAPR